MPNKRVLCKFFAQGSCLKGDSCKFSHDWSAPSNNVCAFYQKGSCSYGSRCRYEHVKVSQSVPSASASPAKLPESLVSGSIPVTYSSGAVSAGADRIPGVTHGVSASSRSFLAPDKPARAKIFGDDIASESSVIEKSRTPNLPDDPLCSYAAAGKCPNGKYCPHMHGDLCPTCGNQCLHPFRPQEREKHLTICKKRQKHLETLKRSEEVECGVCLERVLSKPIAAEQKFGILSECDHSFCISCIRNWRSSSRTLGMDVNSASRTCPICRKLSYFVIPSVIWYYTKEEKAEIIDSYKKNLRSIDCKHFNFGNGICQFGSSCFYKHTVKPGSNLWNGTLLPDFWHTSLMVSDDESEWITDDGEDDSELPDMFEHIDYPRIPFGMGMEDLFSEGNLDDAMSSLLLLNLFNEIADEDEVEYDDDEN